MTELGLETAIWSTLAAATDLGYECLVVADAAARHDPATGERALRNLVESGGVFGAVGQTSELCTAMRQSASPPAPGNE